MLESSWLVRVVLNLLLRLVILLLFDPLALIFGLVLKGLFLHLRGPEFFLLLDVVLIDSVVNFEFSFDFVNDARSGLVF